MAWSKNLSKSTSKNRSIESSDSDNDSSGSITSDKCFQSTNQSNIWTTNIYAADNKSKSLSNARWNLLSSFSRSWFIDVV